MALNDDQFDLFGMKEPKVIKYLNIVPNPNFVNYGNDETEFTVTMLLTNTV